MTRKIRNQINGVLLLDKPLGISSNQAINKVKYLLNASKVGHTGTLDPLATGLLPTCLGEATKFASYLLDGDKEYVATMQLGIVTDSGDAEGNIVANNPVQVDLESIKSAITKFQGEITQIPPMYSALKYNGRPLYEYARAGMEVERKLRQITVYSIEFLNYDVANEQVTFRALVSKGTYIRTLAEDIGNCLGCGASLVSLRRTKTNNFKIENSLTIDSIALEPNSTLTDKILSVDTLVTHLPVYEINTSQIDLVKNGNICQIYESNFAEAEYRLYFAGNFIGVGSIVKDDSQLWLRPKRMFSNIAAS